MACIHKGVFMGNGFVTAAEAVFLGFATVVNGGTANRAAPLGITAVLLAGNTAKLQAQTA
jgi:hypothetical protein